MMAEEVSLATGLGFPDAVSALISLEIRSLVTGDGGRYRRAVELGPAPRLPEPGRSAARPTALAPSAGPAADGGRRPSG